MRLRQTILSPLLRSVAAAVLVGYVAAQTLCFIHCNFGSGHGDSAPPSCHSVGTTQASHDEGDSSSPPAPTPTTPCFTLKNPLVSGDAPTLVVPQFFVLYLLSSCALALDTTALKSESIFCRQANHRDWVLTPVVWLGPAFRSLAPPFVC